MTAQVVETASLQYRNPVSSPEADSLHAPTLMTHWTMIDVVLYTDSCPSSNFVAEKGQHCLGSVLNGCETVKKQVEERYRIWFLQLQRSEALF
jgi:hypothetical protein